MRDAAGGLLPNLIGGGAIVGLPVRGIAVLVRVKIFFGICGDDFVDLANRAVGAFVAGSDYQLSAESGEDALALVRSAVRQAKLHGKLQRSTDHGVSDAGIAAGGVDDGLTVLQGTTVRPSSTPPAAIPASL